jgi:hypothetical protein
MRSAHLQMRRSGTAQSAQRCAGWAHALDVARTGRSAVRGTFRGLRGAVRALAQSNPRTHARNVARMALRSDARIALRMDAQSNPRIARNAFRASTDAQKYPVEVKIDKKN